MGSLCECADRIASGRSTIVAETEAALARIDASQPVLNAFTFVAREQALADAREHDAAPSGGVLHGVPVVVKDLFDVAGWPTTAASRMYEGRIAATDAPAVSSMRAAGAVVCAKTNMHELAFGATGDTSSFGPAHNPWDPARMTGGSSSGSAAAVAGRVVPLALGTDTGGSIRIPAALCGVTGLKTTHGLISIEGVIPLAVTFDTVGPIAEDADDLALAMHALTGLHVDVRDDLAGITIGLAANRSFETIDPAVEQAVRDALAELEKAGARIVDVALPDAEHARDTWADIVFPEFLRAHLFDEALLSEEMQYLVAAGRLVTSDDEAAARAEMVATIAAWQDAFTHVDLVAMPTTPIGAPLHFAESAMIAGVKVPVHGGLLSAKTRQVNVPGIPALSMPCGFDSNAMPIGVQLAGPRLSESLLLAVAMRYQRATPWHRRVPPARF